MEELFEKHEFSNLSEQYPYYPSSEIWRLIIDGNRQEEGPLVFDKGNRGEPGYIHEMKKVLNFVIQEQNTPVTPLFIEKIHDLSIQKIKNAIINKNEKMKILIEESLKTEQVIDISEPQTPPQENYRDNFAIKFSLLTTVKPKEKTNLTLDGLQNLLKFMDKINHHYGKDIIGIEIQGYGNEPKKIITDSEDLNCNVKEFYQEIGKNGGSLCSFALPKNELEKIIANFIQEYELAIKNAKNEEEKLIVIANFIQQLEVLHPFTDANCRTFVILLLTKCLLDNKLTPCILTNPNRFDGYSVVELVKEIKHGQSIFKEYEKTCADATTQILKFMEPKPFFNLVRRMNQLLPKDNHAALYAINYVYEYLINNNIKNTENYLPILKQIYEKRVNEILKTSNAKQQIAALNDTLDTHTIASEIKKVNLIKVESNIQNKFPN